MACDESNRSRFWLQPSGICISSGVYKLNLKTFAGCDSTININEKINNCDSANCLVLSPNIFSISGTNNEFKIVPQNLILSSLEIFDRWGNKVFFTTDPQQTWKGEVQNGSMAVPGVYVYLIKGICTDGKPYNKYGDITLLR